MRSFEKEVLEGVVRRMDKLDISQSALARATGEPQTSISRWLLGRASPSLESIGLLVDYLGGRVVWPEQDGISIAINVDIKGKGAGEWRSIPVLSWQTIGRYPRRAISKEDVISFVLQHATHKSVAGHENVVGVIVGEHRMGMMPTVCPGDTLLVDMGLRTMQSGAISIFCDPAGELRICHVTTKKAGPDTLFLVTEDGRPGHSDIFSLATDFGGRSLDAIVVGEVTGLMR